MSEIFSDVSWSAVIAGAVVAFLVGWLWYSPILFVKGWAEGSGIDMEHSSGPPAGAMITQFAGLLLMSWFVGVTAKTDALFTVILGTLAFAVLHTAGGMFSGKSQYARNVEAGYWIVCLVVMIASQGILRGM